MLASHSSGISVTPILSLGLIQTQTHDREGHGTQGEKKAEDWCKEKNETGTYNDPPLRCPGMCIAYENGMARRSFLGIDPRDHMVEWIVHSHRRSLQGQYNFSDDRRAIIGMTLSLDLWLPRHKVMLLPGLG